MELIIEVLVVFVPLVVFGLIIGRTVERRHLRQLDEFEAQHRDVLVSQVRWFPRARSSEQAPCLVVAEVVIASDSLKSFLAQWRNLFGGEVRSFQTLQTRAKREALVRLTRAALSQGFNAICNVRIESADVGGGSMDRRTPMSAVIASGTAYHAESAA